MTNEKAKDVNELIFSKLEDVIGDLAGIWRATKDDEVVRKYHLLLNCMIDMGWKDSLDLENHLPKRFMPARYFELVEELRKEWAKKLNWNEDITEQGDVNQ
jgi:uncharacterized protein related to proFAR isomerase